MCVSKRVINYRPHSLASREIVHLVSVRPFVCALLLEWAFKVMWLWILWISGFLKSAGHTRHVWQVLKISDVGWLVKLSSWHAIGFKKLNLKARVSWFLEWRIDRCNEKSSGGKIKIGTLFFLFWPSDHISVTTGPTKMSRISPGKLFCHFFWTICWESHPQNLSRNKKCFVLAYLYSTSMVITCFICAWTLEVVTWAFFFTRPTRCLKT